MEDQDKLLAAYAEKTVTLAKLEKATEITKNQRSGIVKQIYEAFGKGPYEVEGRSCNIALKGDTFYFHPVRTASPEGASEKKSGPSEEELAKLVKVVRTSMPASVVASTMGLELGPKFAELLKVALGRGLIIKTGERAQTRYAPVPKPKEADLSEAFPEL